MTHNAHVFTPNGDPGTGLFGVVLDSKHACVATSELEPIAVDSSAFYHFVVEGGRLLASSHRSERSREQWSPGTDLGVTLPATVRPWALLGFEGDCVELTMGPFICLAKDVEQVMEPGSPSNVMETKLMEWNGPVSPFEA